MRPVTTDRVTDILTGAHIHGRTVTISERLTRTDYVAVNKVLTALGGTWSRADKAHVFAEDPSARITAVIQGSELPRPARTAEGFVPTPPDLAHELVCDHTVLAELDKPRVLEPSAGDGALVDAILANAPDATVVAVEPNFARAADLATRSGVSLVTSTFEAYAVALDEHADTRAGDLLADDRTVEAGPDEVRFDAVVMNPPFAMPGHPTAWIDHVRLAWRLLKPGGRLTAIVPNGYVFRTDRRHTAIRGLVDQVGGHHVALPDGAFGTSGVRTVVLTMDKPLDHDQQPGPAEPAPPRRRGKYQAAPEEIAERRAADRELVQLIDAVLGDPDAAPRMQAALDASGASAKVLGYTPRNQAMLLTQCEARGIPLVDVDSAAGWRTRGRRVRPHTAGLRIVAPRGKNTTSHPNINAWARHQEPSHHGHKPEHSHQREWR